MRSYRNTLIFCFANLPRGPIMNELMVRGNSRMCLFTGSQNIADKLCIDLQGKIKLEDAGFDWKIMGPDPGEVDYNVWQCDQDAFAFTGQKCSAQSMIFVHENWLTPEVDFVNKIGAQAAKRNLEDMTLGPVLTWSNEVRGSVCCWCGVSLQPSIPLALLWSFLCFAIAYRPSKSIWTHASRSLALSLHLVASLSIPPLTLFQ